MDLSYPFTVSFGLADTREHCVESAQEVYRSLLVAEPELNVPCFETIAVLARDDTGELDQLKLRELIRIFRPDREGKLTMLDFVISVDSVYKSLKILRASIHNASQIDHAFEQIINALFYIVLACVVMACLNMDPIAIVLTFSSILIAFAFVIGRACSKYFEVCHLKLICRAVEYLEMLANVHSL
jgi:hypothetical protein